MKHVHGFPELTEAQKKEIADLAAMPDELIDTSDIPEWTADQVAEAIGFTDWYRARKEQITARVDADVLAWLKSKGKGYQTLMNQILRDKMLEELGKKPARDSRP